MVYHDAPNNCFHGISRGRMCVYINSCFVCKPEHRHAQTQTQTHRTHTQNTYTQTGRLGWDWLGRLGSAGIGWVRILGRNRVGTGSELGWNSRLELWVGILGRNSGSDWVGLGWNWVGTGSELVSLTGIKSRFNSYHPNGACPKPYQD